jgi:hypothetical protein
LSLVTVSTRPSGAEVRDGNDRVLGTTPLDVRVRSGEQLRLTLQLNGYQSVSVNQRIDGDYDVVRVAMQRAEPVTQPKPREPLAGYKKDPY